jgi:hypothetical protein
MLPSNTTNLLNLTVYATCFGRPWPSSTLKVHNITPKWTYVKSILQFVRSHNLQNIIFWKKWKFSARKKHVFWDLTPFRNADSYRQFWVACVLHLLVPRFPIFLVSGDEMATSLQCRWQGFLCQNAFESSSVLLWEPKIPQLSVSF